MSFMSTFLKNMCILSAFVGYVLGGLPAPSIAAKCLRTMSSLFSPNLIDQSSCRMGLALACVARILHDNWSMRLGENRLDMVLKHLAAMLRYHEIALIKIANE